MCVVINVWKSLIDGKGCYTFFKDMVWSFRKLIAYQRHLYLNFAKSCLHVQLLRFFSEQFPIQKPFIPYSFNLKVCM